MLHRWSRAISNLSKLELQKKMESSRCLYVGFKNYSKVTAAAAAKATETRADFPAKGPSRKPEEGHPAQKVDAKARTTVAAFKVSLNAMFWSKPCSLALAVDSPLRVEEPKYEGIRYFMLKLLLFYSKQSKSIRGANVVYRRIISQVDKPAIYDVFQLEKTFKTTFSLLVLHMWLCLRRLKEEGKEGVEFGQYLYEIYNHDLELRVSKAGVNLLLSKWMKELEKIFYGNIIAYDTAMLPEAKKDHLSHVIWRNVFSDDGSEMPEVPKAASLSAVQAMSRYARRESTCLSLTGKEALFSGNFMFTSLGTQSPDPASPLK